MYKAGTLTYLHSDHLGSTVLTTDTSLNPTGDQRYYAYGRQRDIGPVATDHQFTGQKVDSSGLYYYNARYYDPTLGTFISPDTIVPDPGTVIDYNRYAYTRANPLKFNDPSGHCVNSTTTNNSGDINYNNDECWRLANTIGAMWEGTDYWSNRFNTKEIFFNHIANNADIGTDFFQGQLGNFFGSAQGGQWLERLPTLDYVDSACRNCDMFGDELVVGFGVSADGPSLGWVGVGPSAAIEVVFKDNKVAIFHNVGGGATFGAGANASLYVGLVNNLDDISGYSGITKVANPTASFGPVGVTYGSFRDAVNPNGAYGGFVGWAPGVNLSYTEARTVTSTPWYIYDRYR